MRKLVGAIAVVGLLIGLLAAPSQARRTAEDGADWREKVVFQTKIADQRILRITARYDAAQQGTCALKLPATVEEVGRPCVARPFRNPKWLTRPEAQEATLEIAVITVAGGQETGKTSVVVPFAGQFVP